MTPETILAAFPYLYRNAIDLGGPRARCSYAMKHDVEILLGEYCSEDDLKATLKETVTFDARGPTSCLPETYYFWVKPKFDPHWLRTSPTRRPKGARKDHWDAYQTALAWAMERRASLPASA